MRTWRLPCSHRPLCSFLEKQNKLGKTGAQRNEQMEQATESEIYGQTDTESDTYGRWGMDIPPLVHYPLVDGAKIAITQNPTGVGELGTHLWDSSLKICRWLEKNHQSDPKQWEGKRCIELGSGTGLLGIVAASLGMDVTITDKKSLLPLLNLNLKQNEDLLKQRRNGSEGWPKVVDLFWGTGNPFGHNFHTVLGSDLTYDMDILPILLSTMAALCTPVNEGEAAGEVILSYGKHRAAIPVFFEQAAEYFELHHVPKEDMPPIKELLARGADFFFLKQISQPTGIVRMRLKQK